MDFEENAPQNEGIIHEVYESPEFTTQIDSKNLVQRYFPKQAGLDKY